MNVANPEEKFRSLANALTRSGYDDFFQTLVAELARILGVDYVFIAEVSTSERRAYTLAMAARGSPAANFEYDLQGTPCETVPDRELCLYQQGVADLFPGDALLQQMQIQGYSGMPILTSDGYKLGILSAMSCAPMNLSETDQEILRIAASQVGADMELSRTQRRIRSLTYEDPVTGLPNRRQLLDWLADQQRVNVVLLLDISRFKDINDLHGPAIGDAVLYAVGHRLKSRLADRGYLARLSGDEFVIVLGAGSQNSADQLIQEVQGWFEQPVISGASQFHLSTTLGVAVMPDDVAEDTQVNGIELLRRASVSLAESKALNRPAMIFQPGMVDSRHQRQQLYEKLQYALRHDKLSLAYQPQIELETGALAGAEVLCRWHDDDLGWVSPAQFIPLAEERGLIEQIGRWVMQQACSQLQEWGAAFSGKLSINISNKQLEADTFIETVTAAVHPCSPASLVLELTESALMRAPEHNLRQMQTLAEKGFAWAIDDFGTGYSSLAFLTRMSARYLKIDRSFVARVPSSAHDESVVRTIVAMARSLDMVLIAEGIETSEQLQYLKRIGCQYGQGYLIDHPLDAGQFARKWLR